MVVVRMLCSSVSSCQGAFPPGLAWCDMDLSEVNVEVEAGAVSDNWRELELRGTWASLLQPALAPPPGGVLDLMVRSQQPTCAPWPAES